MSPLAIVFEVAAERPGDGQHRKRRGQQQKAEGHVPEAQLLGIEPAAEQHRPDKAHQPLHGRQPQQDQHAIDQRVGRQRVGAAGYSGLSKVMDMGNDEGWMTVVNDERVQGFRVQL